MSDANKRIHTMESTTFQNREEPHKKEPDKKKHKRLNELTEMTDNRLYKLSAIFPFDLFPNQIIIEQKQVIIIYKQFFYTAQDYHILISDILMPIIETSFFFATLKIELGMGGFQQNPPPVAHLNKNDAIKAKRIIVGLTICHKENIDLSGLSREQILKKIEEIGKYSRN